MGTVPQDNLSDITGRIEEIMRRLEALEDAVVKLGGTLPEAAADDLSDEAIDLSFDADGGEEEYQDSRRDDLPADTEDLPEDTDDEDTVEITGFGFEENEYPGEAAREALPGEKAETAGDGSRKAPEEELHPENLFGEDYARSPETGAGTGTRRGRKASAAYPAEKTQASKAVLDVLTDKLPWLHDMPGTEVKSLRSAIALGDQVLFIRRLFRDDSALYQDSIDRLNSMPDLQKAVAYLTDTFPEWDMEGEDVYRFMMAVRRRIRK